MIKSSGNNIFWVDVLRVLAIFLVVFAHSNSLTQNYSILDLFSFSVYGFFGLISVPLFVMLSGALLLGKNERYLLFFYKRVRKLILPWFFWTCIYVGISLYTGQSSPNTGLELFREIYRTFMGMFWFLPMILGLYVLTPFLRIFIRNARRADLRYIIVIIVIFVSIVPALLGRYYEINSYVIQFLGYYLMGYYLLDMKISTELRSKLGIILLLLLLSYPIYLLLSPQINPVEPLILYSHISPIIFSAACIVFVLIKSYFGPENSYPEKLRVLISKLSSVALGIYLIHILFIMFYNYLTETYKTPLGSISPLFLIPGIAVSVFSFSGITIFLLRKIPVIRRVVG